MSDTAPSLPLDLIVEILSWLPVKSLMRFRCVSKIWNFMVFDPTFVKLHLERSSKNGHILLKYFQTLRFRRESQGVQCWNPDDGVPNVICGAALCSINRLLDNPSSTFGRSLKQFYNTKFIGTCNGLVCISTYDVGWMSHQFQFWNPATRIMSVCSPPLRNVYKHGDAHCPLNCGFGFDELSNTYKVVVVFLDIKSQAREIIVHSMGDTCWRKILTCSTFPKLGKVDGQLASGTVNWLALLSGSDYQWTTHAIDQLVIFSFDLRKDTYRYLLMPEGFVEGPLSRNKPYFGVLKGYLCLAHGYIKKHLVVWLMKEFGVEKSWTQLLKVSYEHLGFRTFKGMPLWMSQDEDVVLLASIDPKTADVVLYNRRHNRIEYSGYTYEKSNIVCFDHVESLVLPY